MKWLLVILGFLCLTVIFGLLAFIIALVFDLRKQWTKLLEVLKKPFPVYLQSLPIPKPKVLIVRLPAKDSEEEFCKCGYPGCLGHEVAENEPIFPGLTSEVVLADMIQRGVKFIRYTSEISHIQES